MGQGKAHKVDPRDRRQLAESPVRFARVAALFRPHRWQLAVVTGIIVASSLVALGQPFLLRGIIDDALPTGNQRLLIWSVIGLVAIAAVTSALGVVQTWLATKVGQLVMHTLRSDVHRHLQAQSVDFFKRTRGGEIQARLTSDVAGLQSVITTSATSLASNVTTVVATTIAMIALSWQLSLLMLVILPPAIWMTRRVAIVRRSVTEERQRTQADLMTQVEESLTVSAAQLNKLLGTAPHRQALFEDTSRRLVDLEMRARLAGRWRTAAMNVTFASVPAAIYLAAGFAGPESGLTVGTVIAFTTLQVAIFRPITGLLNMSADWIASLALLSRIFEYLDLPIEVPAPERPVRLPRGTLAGDVRFEGVHYRYPTGETDVLRGIDLHIPPGTSAAMVGETGSGKSTLASLLARLADPTRGRVLIDGVDLRDVEPTDLTRAVGMVSQETYLTHGTIRDNLHAAKPDATDAELWAALDAARVAHLVRELPDGLDTLVGSRGYRFSGGERQRVAIARTLLRDPPVLVLDEATSSLDNTTEQELQEALDRLSHGRTTLTIAHRLSTVQNADRIYVMAAGEVIEQGTHASLIAAGGAYARLAGAAAPPRLTVVPPLVTVDEAPAEPEPDAPTDETPPLEVRRRSRHRLRWAAAAVAGVAAVVVGFVPLPRVGPAPIAVAGQTSPSDTVETFLRALSRADAEQALSLVVAAPNLTALAGPEVLTRSVEQAALTDIVVERVHATREASVPARYRIGSRQVKTEFRMVHVAGEWRLASPFSTLNLPRPAGGVPVLVNGQRVRTDSVSVLPGTYRVTLDSRLLRLTRNSVVIARPGDPSGKRAWAQELTAKGRRALVNQGRQELAACFSQNLLAPRGCPNQATPTWTAVRGPITVTWTLTNDPWQGFEVPVGAGRLGRVEVSQTIAARVRAHGQNGRVLLRRDHLRLPASVTATLAADDTWTFRWTPATP